MQTNLVSWNPSSRAQFASYSQNKLHLLEFSDESKSGDRTLQEIKAWEAPLVSCLDWRPPSHGSVLAYGTRAGTVHLVNAESGDEVRTFVVSINVRRYKPSLLNCFCTGFGCTRYKAG